MLYVCLKKEDEVIRSFPIRNDRGKIVAAVDGGTHILDILSFSPDFDTLVFSEDDLKGYRHDWEAGEKNHWDEDTAKERLENEYVKPTLEILPSDVDWEWG